MSEDHHAPLFEAVPNFSESPIDAVELLLRASTALRYSRADDNMLSTLSFDEVPPAALR